MAYDEQVWPQDLGTGLDETVDYIDAAPMAWATHAANATDYVVDGFDLDADFVNNQLTITEGVAEFYQSVAESNDHTADGGSPAQQLNHCSFRAQRGPMSELTINEDVNHVYLGLDHAQQNEIFPQINTTASPPPEPYIKLGEVDAVAETVIEMNRQPTATFTRELISK